MLCINAPTSSKDFLADSAAHPQMKQFAKHAILTLALFGLGACASFFDPDSRATHDVALGRIAPGSIKSIPDWTMGHVRSCYAEGLRLNPDQEGTIVFVIRPPEQTGRVESRILDSSGLSTDLVECIRSSFGNIAYYADSGRMQQPVSDTLFLSRSVSQVCAPPTLRAVESIASGHYDMYKIVEVTDIDLVRIEHGVSAYGPERLVRFVDIDVELTFQRDGYEGLCSHGNEYKTFGTSPIEAKGEQECESVHRRKGDRVTDTFVGIFELDQGKWWDAYEGRAYCGNNRQWFSRR